MRYGVSVRDAVTRLSRLALLSLTVVGLAGCLATAVQNVTQAIADATSTKVTFLVPARSAEAATVRRVGLVADNFEVSQRMVFDLEAAMTGIRVLERPYYDAVRPGPRFNGIPSDAQLVGVAKSLGVDGVLFVSGAGASSKRSDTREERIVCSVQTKFLQACPKDKQQRRQVTCTLTEGLAAARVRMVRALDGKVLYADTVGGQSTHRRCSDEDGVPQADTGQLMSAAVADARDNLLRVVAPTYEQRPLDLMAADRGAPAAARKDFDAAMQFAQAKRMDEACRRFDDLYLDNKESAALSFNVAFCHEVRGDLLKASQGYRRASELYNAPNAQIDRRLAQSETAIRQNPVAFMPIAESAVAVPAAVKAAASDGRRVALVIGNARYQRSALVNPVNDARLVSDRLKRIGFDVTAIENADAARLATVTRDFAARAKGAEMALFYYAGHAVQADGENYLMPVDNAKMRTLDDVRNDGGLQLGELTALLDVANPRVKLVVIDACRDNPLPAMTRSLSGAGLAAIKQPPQGALIAFATSPGRTAEDGTGRNSVFSKHFAQFLTTPGQTVEQVFKRVREAVKAETKNRQEPTEVSSLVGDAYFVKPAQ